MPRAAILLGLFFAAATGCNTVSTVESIPAPGAGSNRSAAPMRHFGWLESGAPRVSAENELLNVVVPVTNVGGSAGKVRYRFDWFDAQGMEVNDPNRGWQRIHLESGETRHVSSIAPTPKAAGWRLNLARWKSR